ncbi:MAG: arginine--tRNA ligase [Candidatus Riflebacteria bacterium HGW-Riflebacteria-1]|jgi:arginyl-tRNA synthetase|nr:MAG: arginine--tRNA ligase [Candidatus Riflebacteria bacterium HGW-Riflebacteria-1]
MKKQLISLIHQQLKELFASYGIEDYGFIDVQVPPDKANGDFSLNAAMKLAKAAKCAPQKLAAEMVARLETEKDWFSRVEMAGPGFINLYLADRVIENSFNELSAQASIVEQVSAGGEKTVVDYSSVNIAKQMHVGHLRSTIIGDVLARVIEALGNPVVRQNHLGDWGLPMAMVIWKAEPEIAAIEKRGADLTSELTLARLEELYKSASAECKENPATATVCHDYLVRLQQGDKALLDLWHKIIRISMAEVYRIYRLLDVKLFEENERGESYYRDMLADTVAEVAKSGKLVESQGAQCVFLDEFKGKDGSPLPVIVQKSDGGFNYGTFDLAGLRYRTATLGAQRIVYVTDARQALHFKQIFAVARAAGILAVPDVKLEHVPFGTILGEDNKPLKTRSGENVKLADLLSEAVERAYQVVNEKNPGLSEEQKQQVARTVGIGAVKYADLSQNRNNDYVFSFDRMLALNGNTAPYLQYAHARICSIFRRAGLNIDEFTAAAVISQREERDLMVKLMEFSAAVSAVAAELRPHILCNYLYELAVCFSAFYDKCPVLSCEDEKVKASRLMISSFTRRTLAKGLELLGISAPREM